MASTVNTLSRISDARRALAAASSLDDVLAIRDQAEALRVYMKAASESLETANAAAEIKLRAERKAGEMLAAMEKNVGGRPAETGNVVLPVSSLDDLGIDKMQSSRWQKEASVSEEEFEKYLHQCFEQSREVTQSGLLKIANGTHISTSGENEWYTPPVLIEAARKAMGGIDLDPASCKVAQRNVKAKKYFTIDENGLSRAWRGNVWLNPPYSKDLIGAFAEKLVSESRKYRQAVVLVNNATDTAWFHAMLGVASAVCLLRGRVKFLNKSGEPANTPVQGQAVIYVGEGTSAFADSFESLGAVCFLWRATNATK